MGEPKRKRAMVARLIAGQREADPGAEARWVELGRILQIGDRGLYLTETEQRLASVDV